MGVALQSGYILPFGDCSLKCARIAHAGNWLTGGAVTVSNTAAGFAADGPDNSRTYDRWKPSSVPSAWQYDAGAPVTCDYCCIGAHTLGSAGATVAVQWYNGSGWATLVTVSPEDDMPIMAIFMPQAAQLWRIAVTVATAEIGVIRLGTAMQMPARVTPDGHRPLHNGRDVALTTNLSETGDVLGRSVRRRVLRGAFAWQNLDAEWVRETWYPFQIAAEAEPFFIAWRPEDWADVALAQIDESPVPEVSGRYRERDLMSVEMVVRALAYE